MDRNKYEIKLQKPNKKDTDFSSLVSQILTAQRTQAHISEEAAPARLAERILIAAKNFATSAVHLSAAFVTRAITGQSKKRPHFQHEDLESLRDDIEDLLQRLSWLEQSTHKEVLEEARTNQREEELIAACLSTAVKLKILQRLARYCQLCADDHAELHSNMNQIKALNVHYLEHLAKMQSARSKHIHY